ncbi:MAG: glycosyltransferase family 2 protein [Lachnospiraceae bacterium]|nr:glycosyltransferase family 2 protein [Lachnospiraceae bacterium]
MKQIIYSKFSNERNRALAIRTDILQDGNQKPIVRKAPVFNEGTAHVLKLLEWEERLTEKYRDTFISLNHCEREDRSVCFEYLEGDTLETILDKLYLEGKYEQLLDLFRQYVNVIRKANSKGKFRYTKEFESIFGDVCVNMDSDAADVNNIDMVVGNIIINNDVWNVIDYEWTFDFPIPVNFIIFRTIFYYVYATAKREALKEIGFYRIFGISEKEQKTFMQMEQNFQKYIISEITPIRDMYHGISKGVVDLNEILEIRGKLEEERRMQVYFDYGQGFTEENSEWIYPEMYENNVGKFRINLKSDVKKLRIDPMEEACFVKLYKCVGNTDHRYEMKFESNARQIGKDMYLFAAPDPQIVFTNLREGTTWICLEMIKKPVTYDFAESLDMDTDKLNRANNEKTQKIDELGSALDIQIQRAVIQEQMIADLNHRLYMAESSFHEIQGSFCWKITKPIRVIGEAAHKFFRRHCVLRGFLKSVKRFLLMGPKGMKACNQAEQIEKRSFHIRDEISVTCDMAELEEQRNTKFSTPKKFSIVVPLYNTPELYLCKMIESVLYQTYDNLELCLADGSDKKHRYVRDICKEYRYYDKRICYKKLKKNMGISDNTNACLDMASGDYIVLFDHDDFLHPSALYENMKAIEEKSADFIYTDENTFHETINDAFNPHYKPDFSPDYLRSINYICHLTTFSRELYQKVGMFRREFDGSQDYDMILRLTEQAERIIHIPKVLYYWRAHEDSVAMDIHAKDYCITAARKALAEHLQRVGLSGTVENGGFLSSYHIRYEIEGTPLISILIPNKDHADELKRCLESIKKLSTYKDYEIIIIENNSEETETFAYYDSLKKENSIKVVTWEEEFNYSAINNYGASFAKGEYLLLLNNDVEVVSPDWLQEMLMYVQREDVGAAGAKLYYPNDTIQHAGVIIGIGGVGGHSHKYYPANDCGYFGRLVTVQNLSAVTAACLMVKKSLYDRLGGLDTGYKVAFNDVDFCMKIREAGYLIVFTPYAELYHYESLSRGSEDTPEKVARFNGEACRFMERWKKELDEGDPYYNPNLSLEYEDFRIR